MKAPKLRFKNENGQEFPEWEVFPLSALAQKSKQKNHAKRVNLVLTNSATLGIIPQTDFFEREIVTESNLAGYYVVWVDDFVYNPRISVSAPVGPIKRNKCADGVMSPLYTIFRFDRGILGYFEYYFESYTWHKYIKLVSNSGARHDRVSITDDAFLKLPIKLPSLPEQQKIADFLSSVDERIAQVAKKVDLLERYKRGVLQKIFNQELRFKDENEQEFPEWTKCSLRSQGVFTSGTGFSENEQGGTEGIPFYKVSDMNLPENIKWMLRANNYVSAEQIERHNYKVITGPSIIFAKVGAAIFLERKRVAQNFIIDNNMMAYTPKHFLGFYRYFFEQLPLSSYVRIGALPSLNYSDLKNIVVFEPNHEEQQKIADFLSAIDDKIQTMKTQLEALKQYKKGLLQQMFI